MENGFKNLEEKKDKAMEKFLDLDTKIPEVFILATSVVMIFLSTISQKDCFYWLSFVMFGLVLIISLIVLFFAKGLYKNIVEISGGFLDKIRKLLEQGRNMDFSRFKKELGNSVTLYKEQSSKKIRTKRLWINAFLIVAFILFLLGLLFLAL